MLVYDNGLTMLAIIGILIFGATGLYQYANAEDQVDFVCIPNVQNGHAICSSLPSIGEHGLFVFDSENICPIDVSFTLENYVFVTISESPLCKFNDGFSLVLTIET